MVRAAEPAQPAKKRKPVSMGRLVLRAQAMVNATKSRLVTLKTMFLPQSSELGERTKGPMPKPKI